jgi:hypothetical protein
MTVKPKIEITSNPDTEDQADKISTVAPDPFNVEALKLDQNFEEAAGVRKLVTTVPVRKPHRQEWVRVHPGEDYRGTFAVIELKEDKEYYLVNPKIARELSTEIIKVVIYTAINRAGVLFLWVARLPAPDGRISAWHTSAHEAAERAMKRSVRVQSNMGLGAYEVFFSDNPIPENDPAWPDLPFKELLKIGFQKVGRYVDNFEHPVIKQLRGSRLSAGPFGGGEEGDRRGQELRRRGKGDQAAKVREVGRL